MSNKLNVLVNKFSPSGNQVNKEDIAEALSYLLERNAKDSVVSNNLWGALAEVLQELPLQYEISNAEFLTMLQEDRLLGIGNEGDLFQLDYDSELGSVLFDEYDPKGFRINLNESFSVSRYFPTGYVMTDGYGERYEFQSTLWAYSDKTFPIHVFSEEPCEISLTELEQYLSLREHAVACTKVERLLADFTPISPVSYITEGELYLQVGDYLITEDCPLYLRCRQQTLPESEVVYYALLPDNSELVIRAV